MFILVFVKELTLFCWKELTFLLERTDPFAYFLWERAATLAFSLCGKELTLAFLLMGKSSPRFLFSVEELPLAFLLWE